MSTALTFFAGQADKLLLGRKLGPDALALYGIAIQFALFAPQFIKKIGAAATFPVLSHIAREQPERFSHQLLRVRLLLVGGGVLVSLAFIFGGPTLVRILYPANRFDAGWMLQFLAAGAVGGVIISTYGNALLAHGKSGKIAFLLATHLVLLLAAALTGYHCGAEKGFVIGVSMVEWLNYPFVAFVMIRHRLWQPLIDLAAFLITGAGLAIALLWL